MGAGSRQRGVGRKQARGWRTAGREKKSSAGTEQVVGRWQVENSTRDKVREHAGRVLYIGSGAEKCS
jgi:hypothetical protein